MSSLNTALVRNAAAFACWTAAKAVFPGRLLDKLAVVCAFLAAGCGVGAARRRGDGYAGAGEAAPVDGSLWLIAGSAAGLSTLLLRLVLGRGIYDVLLIASFVAASTVRLLLLRPPSS